MREEVPHRDPFLRGAGEGREEHVHTSVEVELPLVHEDHRQRRRHHDLGQAGEIVESVGRDLGRARVVGEPSEGAQVRERAITAQRQHPAGKRAGRHPGRDDRVHGLETPRSEAPRRGAFRRRDSRSAHGIPPGSESRRGQTPRKNRRLEGAARPDPHQRDPAMRPPARGSASDASCDAKASSRKRRRSAGSSDSFENSTRRPSPRTGAPGRPSPRSPPRRADTPRSPPRRGPDLRLGDARREAAAWRMVRREGGARRAPQQGSATGSAVASGSQHRLGPSRDGWAGHHDRPVADWGRSTFCRCRASCSSSTSWPRRRCGRTRSSAWRRTAITAPATSARRSRTRKAATKRAIHGCRAWHPAWSRC